MAQRHGTWRFTGERSADGRPLRFFTGIPARDLAQRDIDRLDDDQYAAVEGSDLYEKATAPKAEAKREPKSAGDIANAKTKADAASGKEG